MMSAVVPTELPFDCVVAAAAVQANEAAKKIADKIFKCIENKSISMLAHLSEEFLESYLRFVL